MSAFRACSRLGKTIAAGLLLIAVGAVVLAEEAMVDGNNPPPAGLSRSSRIGAPADRSGRAIPGTGRDNPAPAAECRPLVIASPPQLPQGMLQQAYRFRLQVSGAATPVIFSLTQRDRLPPGLNLDPSGWIVGVPQEPGAYGFVVAAADSCRQVPRRTQQRFMVSIGAATRLPLEMDAPAAPHPAVAAPPGGGDLRITRVALAFEEGHAAHMVVDRNQNVPAVVARLQVRGSGVVAGYWVTPANGRIFFKQPVSAPETRITLPAGGSLPSDVAGSYEVRMVLTAPEKILPAARVRYVVRPEALPFGEYIARQLVVVVDLKARPGMASALGAKYGLKLLESHELQSLACAILVFKTEDVIASSRQVASEAGVVVAQPNQVFHTYSEPREAQQGLSRQLDFSRLHAISRGRGATIAIIDTGVDAEHEDLRDNIREVVNFIPEEPYRAEIHGTAVAGIIAARINGIGIAGVAPEAKILAFRACRQIAENDPRGRGNTVSITRAVDAALNRKAGIVNMSIGAAAADRLIAMLIAEGARQGVWFVAPVGNRDDLAAPAFPASCEAVVGVGGVKDDGTPFPNRAVAGAATACAPCENLLTTIPGNRYNFLDGASLSAAVVSGVLALAMEKGPVPRKEEWSSECGDIRRWTETLLGIPACE